MLPEKWHVSHGGSTLFPLDRRHIKTLPTQLIDTCGFSNMLPDACEHQNLFTSISTWQKTHTHTHSGGMSVVCAMHRLAARSLCSCAARGAAGQTIDTPHASPKCCLTRLAIERLLLLRVCGCLFVRAAAK